MKICTRCFTPKNPSEFNKDITRLDGFTKWCKECIKEYQKGYNKVHKQNKKLYYIKNKSNILKNMKQKYSINKKSILKQAKNFNKKYPWKITLQRILQRCNNPKNPYYKNYGGRGIKNFLTEKNIKYLWFRDKAFLMQKPSIDRRDNDGDYELNNCRFIEMRVNARKDKNKRVIQFDLNGNFIKEFPSQIKAGQQLNINNSLIAMCCRKERLIAGGFIWEFKK